MDKFEHALSLIEPLTEAHTEDEAADVFLRAVRPFGVRFYMIGAAGNVTRGGIKTTWRHNWPEDWLQSYIAENKMAYDPVAAAVMRGESFHWRNLDISDPRAKKLMREGARAGMGDGYSFIDASRGLPRLFVTVSGDNLDWNRAETGVVGFLANSLLSRVMFLKDISLAPDVTPLSFREIEVLNHAAVGRTDKATALQLQVSPETVRVHWRSIRRKLKAADRAQAVAIGLWRGDIGP